MKRSEKYINLNRKWAKQSSYKKADIREVRKDEGKEREMHFCLLFNHLNRQGKVYGTFMSKTIPKMMLAPQLVIQVDVLFNSVGPKRFCSRHQEGQ